MKNILLILLSIPIFSFSCETCFNQIQVYEDELSELKKSAMNPNCPLDVHTYYFLLGCEATTNLMKNIIEANHRIIEP